LIVLVGCVVTSELVALNVGGRSCRIQVARKLLVVPNVAKLIRSNLEEACERLLGVRLRVDVEFSLGGQIEDVVVDATGKVDHLEKQDSQLSRGLVVHACGLDQRAGRLAVQLELRNLEFPSPRQIRRPIPKIH